MQRINSAMSLKKAILQLEAKHAQEGALMKTQWLNLYERAKPKHLLTSALQEVARTAIQSKVLKDSVLTAALEIGTSTVLSFFFEEKSKSPFKKIISKALMFGITTLVVQHQATIRAFALELLNRMEQPSNEQVDRDETEMDYSNT
jgi:hypothetical protein